MHAPRRIGVGGGFDNGSEEDCITEYFDATTQHALQITQILMRILARI